MSGTRRIIPPAASPDVRNALALIWDELERSGQSRTSVETRVIGAGSLGAPSTGALGGGSSGGGLPSRETKSVITGSLINGERFNTSLVLHKSCDIQKISTDYPAYVVLYNTDAARTADDPRLYSIDPTPGKGIMAEVLTSVEFPSIALSPVPVFVNDDATPADTAYLMVQNYDEVPRAITVTITYTQREA